MSITASQLIANVNVIGAAEAKANLLGVGAASDEAGSKLSGIVVGGAVLAAAGLVALGAKAVNMAADFQTSMTQLVTGAGESQSNLKMVSSGILAMAGQTGTATKDLASGMYLIESSGQHGSQALITLRDAAEGAKVGAASLADVANGVTTIMTDYAAKHISAAQATNTLIAAVAAGKTHMADLSNAMSTVLPTAAAVGVKLGDTAAAMSTMTGEGTNAATAATYLRQMIMALDNPAKKGADALKSVGLSSSEVSAEMKKSLPDTLQMITDAVGKKFPVGSSAYVKALADISGGSKQMQGMLELTGSHLKVFQGNLSDITDAVKRGGNSIIGWNLVQHDFNQKMDEAKGAVESLMIQLGSMLLPTLSRLLDIISPLLSSFSSWVTSGHAVSDMVNFFNSHLQIMLPIIAAVGAMILAVLVPAVWSLAAGVIAATWPLLAIGLAVAGVTAALVYAYQHWTGFRDVVNTVAGVLSHLGTILPQVWAAFTGSQVVKSVLAVLQEIGSFIGGQFIGIWHMLVSMWTTQLQPAFVQIWASLKTLVPLFELLGFIIGTVVVVGIGLLVGLLGGVVKGLANLITGITFVFTGIIQVITGALAIIGGVVRVFVDLFTGNFKDMGAAFGQIWQGIVDILSGALNIIRGLFVAVFGTIWGIVSGFVQGVIGFFVSLYDSLVGHSIIPDMINAILEWFASLPGKVMSGIASLLGLVGNFFSNLASRAIALVTSLVTSVVTWFAGLPGKVLSAVSSLLGSISNFFHGLAMNAIVEAIYLVTEVENWFRRLPGKVLSAVNGLAGALGGFFGGLASSALAWGSNIVNNIAAGISGAVGAVTGAIGHIASIIAAHLPHSPAEVGPLRDLPLMGSKITQQVSEGMLSAMPTLKSSMNVLLNPMVHQTVSPVFPSMSSSLSANGGGGQSAPQPVYLVLDGHILASALQPHMVNSIRRATGVKF